MSTTAKRTDPKLWETVKQEVTAGDKGGNKGEWSARKAQLAVAEYKKRGGRYAGKKDPHNSLHEWTEEDWGTSSGKKSGDTHERYLPKKAREALSDEDYARTTKKKRADTKKGRQFSAQPTDVSAKVKPHRDPAPRRNCTRWRRSATCRVGRPCRRTNWRRRWEISSSRLPGEGRGPVATQPETGPRPSPGKRSKV